MSIDVLLQQIVNGLVVGSVYALVALGYTMVTAFRNSLTSRTARS